MRRRSRRAGAAAARRLEYVLFYWRLQVMRVKTLLGRPYAALYGMDRKLEHYIGFKGGTFIEAGANDGLAQSNTYFLAKHLGWSGLLVEPVPKYFRMCTRARKARTVNCALGPVEKEGTELEILTGGLMSVPTAVQDRFLHGRSVRDHAAFGAREFEFAPPRRTHADPCPFQPVGRGRHRHDRLLLARCGGIRARGLAGTGLQPPPADFHAHRNTRPQEVASFLGTKLRADRLVISS